MLFKRLIVLMLSVLLFAGISNANPDQKQETENTDEVPEIFVEMKTNQGVITLALDGNKAPNTVGNFIQYVIDKHYDGMIFHRVIPGFMIQGGGYDAEMNQKENRAPINIESNNGLKNVKGSIAMARTNNPNSATSQFFINTVDNGFLDYPGADGHGYTVFGKVIDGLDVVMQIEKVKTGPKAFHQDVPETPVIIESVKLIERKNADNKQDKAEKAQQAAPAKDQQKTPSDTGKKPKVEKTAPEKTQNSTPEKKAK